LVLLLAMRMLKKMMRLLMIIQHITVIVSSAVDEVWFGVFFTVGFFKRVVASWVAVATNKAFASSRWTASLTLTTTATDGLLINTNIPQLLFLLWVLGLSLSLLLLSKISSVLRKSYSINVLNNSNLQSISYASTCVNHPPKIMLEKVLNKFLLTLFSFSFFAFSSFSTDFVTDSISSSNCFTCFANNSEFLSLTTQTIEVMVESLVLLLFLWNWATNLLPKTPFSY